MNRFSRIRHHVDMKDVKKRHLEETAAKKLEEKRLKEEAQQIKAKYEKCKVDWRNELNEGMTVGGFMVTTLPSEGEEALVNNDTKNVNDGTVPYPLNPHEANTLPGVSDIFAPGPANVIDPNGKGDNEGVPYGTAVGGGFGGGAIWASSTLASSNNSDAGNGENSGFDMGGPYARMYERVGGPQYGTIPYRYLTLAPTDTTELSHLRITAIQGNNPVNAVGNGGASGWDINGAKEQASIRVRYWVPGMSDFQYLSVNPQGQTTRGQFGQDQLNPTDVIVPYDANASTPTNFSIELPKYARGKDVRFQLYQKATVQYNIFYGQHWGVSNISYQRRTPISVFVSLDDPEATSFVRVGQGTKKSSPQKRKKRVNDILSASKEYVNKYLGSDFPGSSTELSPETSPKVSSVDQEIADVQQQKRDSMSQQTKDRFDGDQPETMNNEPKVPDFTKYDNPNDLEDAFQATYQQYSKDLKRAYENYGREVYKSWLKGAQSNWDNFQKNRPEGPRSPRPTFDEKQEKAYIRNVLNGIFYVYDNTPAGKVIKALKVGLDAMISAYANAQDQLRKRSQKDKGEDPQAEPVKGEGGEDVDAAQTMADIEKLAPEITQQEINLDDVKSLEDLPKNKVLEIIAQLGRFQTKGLSLPFDLTIKYAMGDYTPVTKSPGALFDNVTLRAIENAHIKYPGRNKVSTDNYLDIPSRFAQAAFQHFDYEVTPKGIRVKDDFNFNDPDNPASTHIGWFAIFDDYLPHKIKAQTIATNLIKIGDKRAQMLGYDPRDDQFGIPINYIIPYHRLSKKQKKLFYPELFRNEKKREALSLDEPIVTSSRSSKKSKKKNKEG
tara:strand:+ start:75 stop:2579 length:2505 start_codon:yes stop_codon:yes gene_type:complete